MRPGMHNFKMMPSKFPMLLALLMLSACVTTSSTEPEEYLTHDALVPESDFLEESLESLTGLASAKAIMDTDGSLPSHQDPKNALMNDQASKQRDLELLQGMLSDINSAHDHTSRLQARLEKEHVVMKDVNLDVLKKARAKALAQTKASWGSSRRRRRWWNPWTAIERKGKQIERGVKNLARAAFEKARKLANHVRAIAREKLAKAAAWARERARKIAAAVREVAVKAHALAMRLKNAAIRAAKRLAAKLAKAAAWVKMIIDIFKEGLTAMKCIFTKGKKLLGSVGELTGNPKAYFTRMSKELDGYFPALLQTCASGIAHILKIMKSIDGEGGTGGKINPERLLKLVVRDVEKLGQVIPGIKCIVPPLKRMMKLMSKKSSGNQLLQAPTLMLYDPVSGNQLLQAHAMTQSQDIMASMKSFLMEGARKKVIPMLVSLVAPPLNQTVMWIVDKLTTSAAFKEAQAGLNTAFHALKKNHLLTNALKLFNSAQGQQAKDVAVATLKDVLSKKVSVTDVLKSVTELIRQAVMKPILKALDDTIPPMYDLTIGKATKGIMSIISFVVEEILAEPLPLTMWGMEIIGEISEPLKVVWNMIDEQAKLLFTKAVVWMVKSYVNLIFKLPALGAGVAGPQLQKVADKISDFSAGVQRFLGPIKAFIKAIPEPIMTELSKMGRIVYEKLIEGFAPDLKAHLTMNKLVLSEAVNQVCGEKEIMLAKDCDLRLLAEPVLNQSTDLESIKTEMLQHFENGFPSQQESFEEHLKADPSIPIEMYAELTSAPRKRNVGLKDVVKGLQTLHREKHKSVVTHTELTTFHVQQLWKHVHDTKDIRDIEAYVQTLDKKPLRDELDQLKTHMKHAKTNFVQTRFTTSLMKFFNDRKADIRCVLDAGMNQGASLLKQFSGKGLHQILPTVWKMLETFVNDLFGKVKEDANSIKKQLLEGGVRASDFVNKLMNGVDRMGKVIPAIKCFRPMIESSASSAVDSIKKFLNASMTTLMNFVNTVAIPTITMGIKDGIDTVGGLIMGDRWPILKAGVENGWITIQNGVSKVVADSLEKIQNMKLGEPRDLAVNALKMVLTGKFTLAQLMPAAFNVAQNLISEGLTWLVSGLLPVMYDRVLGFAEDIVTPAATIGINMLAATGSCFTEWISSGLMNLFQSLLTYVKGAGRTAVISLISTFIDDALNNAFKSIEKFVVKPLVSKVLAPLDKGANAIIAKMKSIVKTVTDQIPPQVLDIARKLINTILKEVIKEVAPIIVEQGKLNLQLAQTIVSSSPVAELAQNEELASVETKVISFEDLEVTMQQEWSHANIDSTVDYMLSQD